MKHTHPMDTAQMQQVLDRAGQNRLRYLDPTQLSRMRQLRVHCVLCCAFIGMFFTGFPASVENFLVSELEVDGVKDAYWVCHNHTVPNRPTGDGESESFLYCIYMPAIDRSFVRTQMMPTLPKRRSGSTSTFQPLRWMSS